MSENKITVKPLVWSKYGEANGFGCRYAVYETREGWNCVKYPNGVTRHRIAEDVPESAAIAAAQADYEQRILSAIDVAYLAAKDARIEKLEKAQEGLKSLNVYSCHGWDIRRGDMKLGLDGEGAWVRRDSVISAVDAALTNEEA